MSGDDVTNCQCCGALIWTWTQVCPCCKQDQDNWREGAPEDLSKDE